MNTEGLSDRDCDAPESSIAVILGQVVIALSGGEILYFEIDESHTLNEVAKRDMNYEASPDSHSTHCPYPYSPTTALAIPLTTPPILPQPREECRGVLLWMFPCLPEGPKSPNKPSVHRV